LTREPLAPVVIVDALRAVTVATYEVAVEDAPTTTENVCEKSVLFTIPSSFDASSNNVYV
jgi:hypothetical protein